MIGQSYKWSSGILYDLPMDHTPTQKPDMACLMAKNVVIFGRIDNMQRKRKENTDYHHTWRSKLQ